MHQRQYKFLCTFCHCRVPVNTRCDIWSVRKSVRRIERHLHQEGFTGRRRKRLATGNVQQHQWMHPVPSDDVSQRRLYGIHEVSEDVRRNVLDYDGHRRRLRLRHRLRNWAADPGHVTVDSQYLRNRQSLRSDDYCDDVLPRRKGLLMVAEQCNRSVRVGCIHSRQALGDEETIQRR